jgi:hypothetical protein
MCEIGEADAVVEGWDGWGWVVEDGDVGRYGNGG